VYVYLFFSCSIPDSIGKEVEKKCQSVFPLQNVFIRKVKILKMPRFDVQKLLELHAAGSEEIGVAVERSEPSGWSEPVPADSV
jgi:small subunit ribosomal protein S3Ae